MLWSEEKILEVFSGVIKCFPENISWDQIDGGICILLKTFEDLSICLWMNLNYGERVVLVLIVVVVIRNCKVKERQKKYEN